MHGVKKHWKILIKKENEESIVLSMVQSMVQSMVKSMV